MIESYAPTGEVTFKNERTQMTYKLHREEGGIFHLCSTF